MQQLNNSSSWMDIFKELAGGIDLETVMVEWSFFLLTAKLIFKWMLTQHKISIIHHVIPIVYYNMKKLCYCTNHYRKQINIFFFNEILFEMFYHSRQDYSQAFIVLHVKLDKKRKKYFISLMKLFSHQ